MPDATQPRTIRVKITAERSVRYRKIVYMTPAEWAEIKETPECDMEDSELSPIARYLDDSDINDADDFEDVELTVVDDQGKDKKPLDYYKGDGE